MSISSLFAGDTAGAETFNARFDPQDGIDAICIPNICKMNTLLPKIVRAMRSAGVDLSLYDVRLVDVDL